MVFHWDEYLRLARFLESAGSRHFNQEAAQRSAASRAYYAAFCHARNSARDHHQFEPDYDQEDHSRVRADFTARGMRDIADKLRELRQWRNMCDYQDTVYNLQTLVFNAISRANEILSSLP